MSTKDRFSDLNKNTRTEGGLPVISERNIHFKVIANQDANVTSYAQKPVEYWEMGKSLNIQGNIFHPMKITKRGKYGIFFPFFCYKPLSSVISGLPTFKGEIAC